MRFPLSAIGGDDGVLDALAQVGGVSGSTLLISDRAPDASLLASVACGGPVPTTTTLPTTSTTTLPTGSCTGDEQCEDGDACNGVESCDGAGSCAPGTPLTCTALDSCHDVGLCNSATGVCNNPAKPDGAPCVSLNTM